MVDMNAMKLMGGIQIRIGGEVVGEMESISADMTYSPPSLEPEEVQEAIVERKPMQIRNICGTVEMRDAVINRTLLKDIMDMPQMFDVEVKKWVKGAPPRKLRSKSKRLRKKWAKKYPSETSRYKNCMITGVQG